MKQKLFLLPAGALLLASVMAGACSKPTNEIETPEPADSIIKVPEWGDTIVINISFGPGAQTRATAADANVTDLWLLDYMDGELKQTIHQQKTDEGFGSAQMAVEYGTHALRVIASTGTDGELTDSILTWAKPGDTFFSADTFSIAPQGDKNISIQLKRVATRLRITIDDELPAELAKLGITARWYYGLNAKSGEACADRTEERIISVPAQYVGTTGQLTAGFYSLCPLGGYTTDATIKALRADDTTLQTIELHDVQMQRNRMTAYSGTMFANTRSVDFDFSTDWDAALEIGW